MKNLYIDMDGTVAKFYEDEHCVENMYEPDFFFKLKPYENFVQAILILKRKYSDLISLKILSAAPTIHAVESKKSWVLVHLGDLPGIYCLVGADKAAVVYQETGHVINQDDVLIDDYSKNLIEWREAGGHPVKFRNEFNGQGLNNYNFVGDKLYYDRSPEQLVMDILDICGIEPGERHGR